MSPKVLWVIAATCAVADMGLLLVLVLPASAVLAPAVWLVLHILVCLIGAGCVGYLLAAANGQARWRYLSLVAVLGLSCPGVGLVGAGLCLSLATKVALQRHRADPYWQFTSNPALPFTTPVGRAVVQPDSRGILEQLMFETDGDELYRRVLAAGRMPSNLSVHALQQGVRHSDERIRLTAYQTLDRKVTQLNDEIDRLARLADQRQGRECSDTWLQIASNYWELLTLEQNEPVARAQLLDKASIACVKAIGAFAGNRNAHYTLGRIALRQGRPEVAEAALAKAEALGMPCSTTVPYQAEAAFAQRDYQRTRRLINRLDDAFKAYPPLKPLAEFWR